MSNKEIFEAIAELAKQLDQNTAGIIVVGAYDTEGKGRRGHRPMHKARLDLAHRRSNRRGSDAA